MSRKPEVSILSNAPVISGGVRIDLFDHLTLTTSRATAEWANPGRLALSSREDLARWAKTIYEVKHFARATIAGCRRRAAADDRG